MMTNSGMIRATHAASNHDSCRGDGALYYRWVGLGTSVLLSVLWLGVLDTPITHAIHVKTLVLIALQMLIGYWIGEHYDRIRTLAYQDSLTGVLVNRRFYEQLEREVARARRHHYPVTLLFIDLDNFKKYNDKHGHIAGDQILCQFADLLRGSVRQNDILGRWGGEEFVVLLPQTDIRQGMAVGERIRNNVRQQLNGVTVSIGLATFPDHADSAVELTARADAIMYEAKKQRDCMLTPSF